MKPILSYDEKVVQKNLCGILTGETETIKIPRKTEYLENLDHWGKLMEEWNNIRSPEHIKTMQSFWQFYEKLIQLGLKPEEICIIPTAFFNKMCHQLELVQINNSSIAFRGISGNFIHHGPFLFLAERSNFYHVELPTPPKDIRITELQKIFSQFEKDSQTKEFKVRRYQLEANNSDVKHYWNQVICKKQSDEESSEFFSLPKKGGLEIIADPEEIQLGGSQTLRQLMQKSIRTSCPLGIYSTAEWTNICFQYGDFPTEKRLMKQATHWFQKNKDIPLGNPLS